MIYDIIAVAIFIIFLIWGVYRGAAKSLVGLGITFVSYTGATFLGKLISSWVFQYILKPTIHDTVVTTVSDFSHDTLNDALSKFDLGSFDILGLQDSLKGLVADRMESPIEEISANAGVTAENVMEPIIIGIMSFFITIFVFILIYVLLSKLLMPLIMKVFHLPVIRQVDMVLGGVVGVIEALLVVCMLAYLLKLLIPQIQTDIWMLKEETINKSFIFKVFYDGNIFSMFASWLKI